MQLDSNGSGCELRLHVCNRQIMENGNKESVNSRWGCGEAAEQWQCRWHSENDDSEDDFDGYLEEIEIDGWWNRREKDSSSDEEGKQWC